LYYFSCSNQYCFMKKYVWIASALVAGVITMNACQTKSSQEAKTFLDPTNIDSSVKPGDDFFTYANGAWIKRSTIPSTDNEAAGFYDLYKSTQQKLKGLLEDLSKGNNKPGSLEQQVGDMYAAGMDSAAIEKRGYEPVKPL